MPIQETRLDCCHLLPGRVSREILYELLTTVKNALIRLRIAQALHFRRFLSIGFATLPSLFLRRIGNSHTRCTSAASRNSRGGAVSVLRH